MRGLLATRAGLIGLAVIGGLAWRAYDVHHQRQIGAGSVLAQIETQTERINEKARKARAAARAPGAAQRVRDNFCRDC